MSKPFDSATKRLVEAEPGDWLAFAGLPSASAHVIDADLSTITAEADKVLHVGTAPPFLAHIEFQAGHDPEMGRRLLRYNVLLHYRHALPVRSVVVLLRREADGPGMAGQIGYEGLDFRYGVLRVWQTPVEDVLNGGLGTLPLAPLADVGVPGLPGVVRRMERRIDAEAAPDEAGMLWVATYLLMGLKYDPATSQRLLKGVRELKESATYQALLEEGASRGRLEGRVEGRVEGRAEEARSLLLRLGGRRFGPPDARVQAAVAAVGPVEQVEALAERVLETESWDELLAG